MHYTAVDLRLRRSNSDSRPAEHVLIESQEEVRSYRGSSLRSGQIRSIIQAGSGNEAKSRENRLSPNSLGPESSFSLNRQAQSLRPAHLRQRVAAAARLSGAANFLSCCCRSRACTRGLRNGTALIGRRAHAAAHRLRCVRGGVHGAGT
jgi:hypothetical protein